jgi:hypothetical protein
MEKISAIDYSVPSWAKDPKNHKLVADFVNKNAPLIGAVVGATFGAVLGGTDARTDKEVAQDPKASLRNRLSAMIGGATGGAITGGLMRGSISNPLGTANFAQTLSSVSASSANAGRAIGDLLAPQTAVPRTVSEILGKKQQYSDKALFQKYWDEFGSELETKGPKAKLTDKSREEKFVTALRDLYTTAATQPDAPAPKSKGNYLLSQAAGAAMAPVGIVAQDMVMGRLHELSDLPPPKTTAKNVSLRALPSLIGTAARTAKGYKQRFMDPRVAVENKSDAVDRSKFDDEKLRRLLRGLKVEEVKVKQHVIK